MNENKLTKLPASDHHPLRRLGKSHMTNRKAVIGYTLSRDFYCFYQQYMTTANIAKVILKAGEYALEASVAFSDTGHIDKRDCWSRGRRGLCADLNCSSSGRGSEGESASQLMLHTLCCNYYFSFNVLVVSHL